ncbi:MAG: hypothetical protein C0603_07845 [Denitrovibrio sp.]|nr:MAG: hypothetical protein C0603_07845 [Denitrovibrio sp.]
MSKCKGSALRSFIYELNPAIKLILFLVVMQMTAISSSLASFVFFSVVFLLLAYNANLTLGAITNRLKPFALIILFTFLINLIFGSGLYLSLSLAYKFLLIILFSLLLTITTDPQILASVILSPFKGRHASNLRVVLMVAIEFIPVLIDEVKSIAKSLSEMPEYLTKKYKILFKPDLYLVPLINGIISKSEDVAKKVEAGEYTPHAISKPQTWEILLAFTSIVLAVKYAL